MLQVRTKFHSGLDRHHYMGDMLIEFLEVYEDCKEKQAVKPINMEFIGQINEYGEKYIYFQRVTTIIAAFIKQFDGMDDILHKLIHIKQSAKKQKGMIYGAKRILKNVRFDEKYEEPIRYNIRKVNERLDYLLTLVDSAYIEMTPLYNYKKKLEAEGKSFFEEIVNEFPLDERIGCDEDNEEIQKYIQKVLSSFSDDGDWKKGFEEYNKFLQEKYQKIEECKKAEKMQAKKERQEMTEKRLMNESQDITRRYEDAMITTGFNYGINHLHNEIYRLKKEGKERNKIVLLAKTLKGYDAAIHYYSATAKDPLVNSLSRCSVLGEFDTLPEELMKKVDSYDLAMIELVLE